MARPKANQISVEDEVASHKTRPGYESGMYAQFVDDSPRMVGTHVSWRQYVQLWMNSRLRFQVEGTVKPDYYPSLLAAQRLEEIERRE